MQEPRAMGAVPSRDDPTDRHIWDLVPVPHALPERYRASARVRERDQYRDPIDVAASSPIAISTSRLHHAAQAIAQAEQRFCIGDSIRDACRALEATAAIAGYARLRGRQDWQIAIWRLGHAWAAMPWTPAWQTAKGGILSEPAGPSSLHAFLALGWDDEQRAFWCQNTWGRYWGAGGFFWLPYRYVTDESPEAWAVQPASGWE